MGNTTSPDTLRLRWAEIENDPSLRDLPYKIELNAAGKLEMSPASYRHGRVQGYIAVELGKQLQGGAVLGEVPIVTAIGVRVPDVAWASDDYISVVDEISPLPRAPEICVEVMSPSNSAQEMEEKTRAYLAVGAQEVWLASADGTIRYFDAAGERGSSAFPISIPPMPQGAA